MVIQNKKATFEFHLFLNFKAGIVLTGTEVKSIRAGKASLSDAYCIIQNEELWLLNMHVTEYKEGSYNNHEPKRQRKLLLTKSEMKKIHSKVREKGVTIIPVQLFFNERGYAKVEISLARGKKLYDKRESIKEKDVKRQMARNESD